MNFRSAKAFLIYGGIVLVAIGVLGFGFIGPSPQDSIFGSAWTFTVGENWTHLILGVVALGAAFVLKSTSHQRLLVNIVGVVALLFGLLGFFLPSDYPNFLGANLENPMDNLLHIIVAIWAFWAANGAKEYDMANPPQPNPVTTA